ncbi:hypothetical protein SCACP_40530 [Sporomusa carbonis]|uniref:hypothetical protein n=1 Tax=Sporomusa carbonis TaxID=3076075 RepID=UPI003A726C67
MVEQAASIEAKYLQELYEDLYVKSAIDINATIGIISWIEDISRGENAAKENWLCPETSCLPGKPPMELVAEFMKFWTTTTERPTLDSILELRNSLYRFQSL